MNWNRSDVNHSFNKYSKQVSQNTNAFDDALQYNIQFTNLTTIKLSISGIFDPLNGDSICFRYSHINNPNINER